ncbi:MAG: hypothetical protein M1541_02845, partial [Acidobacteria bacterium]|nr:hypothetical protein [Acidobacteriota bacterium]
WSWLVRLVMARFETGDRRPNGVRNMRLQESGGLCLLANIDSDPAVWIPRGERPAGFSVLFVFSNLVGSFGNGEI